MKLLKGYILLSELYKKANVSVSLFQQLDGVIIDKIQGLNIVIKSTVPQRYKEAANQCQDLEYYYPYSYLSVELGYGSSYLSAREQRLKKKFDSIQIGRARLLKVNDEFIKIINEGLTPFKLTSDSKQYQVKTIIMQGIKIGFY